MLRGVRPATRRYLPAARLRLATARLAPDLASSRLSSLLDHLQRATGEEILVAVQSGIDATYIHRRKARLPFFGTMRCGARRALCRTSTGKMLLSLKNGGEIGRIVRRVNADGRHRSVEQGWLLDEVDRARVHRFATAFDDATPGAAGIAALLPSPPAAPPMALAICGTSDRIRTRQSSLIEELEAGIAARAPAP